MSRTSIAPCFLLALLLGALSCGKEDTPTVINGIVTDRKTGETVEGALIYMTGKKKGNSGQDEFFTHACPRTDANGVFSCTIQGDYSSSEVTKNGYVDYEKFLAIGNGEDNNVNISLVPRDGFLRLQIENNTGQHNTLYASVYSHTVTTEGRKNTYWSGEVINIYPLLLNQGEIYTEVIDLPSPEIVQIRWGFGQTTLVDSIMVVTNDTTTYLLSY